MTALYLLEAVGLWAMAHTTFASKLAATQNEIFFVKKISQHIKIIYRFVCILHYVFQSSSFIIFAFCFILISWQGKKCTRNYTLN